jgi:hypothetical protein
MRTRNGPPASAKPPRTEIRTIANPMMTNTENLWADRLTPGKQGADHFQLTCYLDIGFKMAGL